jgi:hypothetical protein
MNLSETTRKVLHLVEERSGIPVHVEADPNLPGTLLAKVIMARGSLALHQVFYRPNGSAPPDYLICSQAAFILRLFSTPPEKRFDFASARTGRLAVEKLVKDHPVSRLLPAEQLPKYCDMLRDGLLSHLRSIPVGMRVEKWLAENFSELASLQKQAVLRQVQDSVATLATQHRDTAPKLIYDATQSISAAYAAFWANRFQQHQLALPFKAAGYLDAGLALLKTWEELPDAPENDRLIVDRWAEKLGVAGWYQWVPYSSPK